MRGYLISTFIGGSGLSYLATSPRPCDLHFHSLAGEGSNLQPPDPKSGVLPLNYPPR
jgi:hypothetical protein